MSLHGRAVFPNTILIARGRRAPEQSPSVGIMTRGPAATRAGDHMQHDAIHAPSCATSTCISVCHRRYP
ncbi:hypothetical protein GY45DRAFT_867769 [Cubamyces sp. BRFM 1775]|nr:hypothetical protein GY45DRAFT_867769 [Cubamyces sp. BRFM 1775]